MHAISFYERWHVLFEVPVGVGMFGDGKGNQEESVNKIHGPRVAEFPGSLMICEGKKCGHYWVDSFPSLARHVLPVLTMASTDASSIPYPTTAANNYRPTASQ